MSKHTYIDSDLDADPILVPHNGRLGWLFPSGHIVPDVRGGADEPSEKKFTQEDVDRMMTERVKNLKAEPPADYAQFKADAAELATLKAANEAANAKNRTDAEATDARIAALEADVRKANDATAAAAAATLVEKRRSAIVAAAAVQKAANPNQVAALLPQDAVTIGDDGQVKDAEVSEAVKNFLTENPHFVGVPVRPRPDNGQGKTGEVKGFGDAGRAEAQKRFGAPVEAGAQK